MHILSPVLLPLPQSLFLQHPFGLGVDSSLPLKPDNREENEHNSNKYNLLNAFHLAMPSSLPILSYSVFTTGKMHYHPHFSNKEIEAGQGEALCQKYHMETCSGP